jgi:hypothetical protein
MHSIYAHEKMSEKKLLKIKNEQKNPTLVHLSLPTITTFINMKGMVLTFN